MAIQILGLRDYINQAGQKQKREQFFARNWRVPDVESIFDPAILGPVLETIPEAERFNLYFTVADCFEERVIGEKGRRLREQHVIPFDIDNLAIPLHSDGMEEAAHAARHALACLGIDLKEAAVLFSGNGVQFFIKLDAPILSDDYFDHARDHYAAVCRRIQAYLVHHNIKGTVDTSVFSAARLMRLPNTRNIKPNKPERMARIINGTMKTLGFDLFKISGIESVEPAAHLSDIALKNYPKPDTKAVCAGCKFLQHCEQNQEKISEPQWYAAMSIWARLDGGRDMCHASSERHPNYSHYETEIKIDQALSSAGPRTCRNIDTLWDGCRECDHYGKVTSPIMIRGEDYIASADFGYRERKVDNNGNIKPGPVAYEDLIKQYTLDYNYKTFKEGNLIYTYNGKYWEPKHDLFVLEWVTSKVTPPPSGNEMREFTTRLKSRRAATVDWFNSAHEGLMNFNNCVLDIRTLEIYPHSPDHGFFSCLPFNYNREAKCPTWDKFIMDVMEQDEDKAKVLKEFAGYCISGDNYWIQKALLLVGDGANGKSTFMEMLAECVGKGFYSSVPLQDLRSPQSRHMLVGKTFNYSEETSPKALSDSEVFKALVAGGEMEVKQLYVQPYRTNNRAKLILSANEMPYSKDKTNGLYRRMIILEFNARFEGEKADPFIKSKLREELPGIITSLVMAYREAKERGGIHRSTKVEQALDAYKLESNNVLRFVQDHVERVADVNAYEVASEVYQRYIQYCELEGEHPTNNLTFGKQIAKILRVRSEPIYVQGTKTRVYKQIKMQKEY